MLKSSINSMAIFSLLSYPITTTLWNITVAQKFPQKAPPRQTHELTNSFKNLKCNHAYMYSCLSIYMIIIYYVLVMIKHGLGHV